MLSLSIKNQRVAALAAAIGLVPIVSSASSIVVQNCNDAGAGSLRKAVADAGDMGSVSIPLSCTISLQTGAIAVTQSHLTITGSNQVALTITGLHNGTVETGRIFEQSASGGYLALNDMTIQAGNVADGSGGCVYSAGDVKTSNVTISQCTATAHTSIYGRGGGIYAKGAITLTGSRVTGNTVTGEYAVGGGIYSVGAATLSDSVISGNTADGTHVSTGPNYIVAAGGGGIASQAHITLDKCVVADNRTQTLGYALSGGIQASRAPLTISNSTISGNDGYGIYTYNAVTQITGSTVSGNLGGGISSYSGALGNFEKMTILNSTVSGNHGYGILARQPNILIANSTVAFNDYNGFFGYRKNTAPYSIEFESSLFSNNQRSDVQTDDASHIQMVITGENNLVPVQGAMLPVDTIQSCPLLGPLRENGGPTQTHALQSRSPAIDAGNTVDSGASPQYDQRGAPYLRSIGTKADIGAYERNNADDVFSNGFDGC